MFKHKLPKDEQGFTLVEVLVAILLMTLFAAISMQGIVILNIVELLLIQPPLILIQIVRFLNNKNFHLYNHLDQLLNNCKHIMNALNLSLASNRNTFQ